MKAPSRAPAAWFEALSMIPPSELLSAGGSGHGPDRVIRIRENCTLFCPLVACGRLVTCGKNGRIQEVRYAKAVARMLRRRVGAATL